MCNQRGANDKANYLNLESFLIAIPVKFAPS